jgi:hypothetical protein
MLFFGRGLPRAARAAQGHDQAQPCRCTCLPGFAGVGSAALLVAQQSVRRAGSSNSSENSPSLAPARPCLPGRILPPGPAPLLLPPSLGLAFRQHTARRAANRLYSPSRLCLFATHSPTTARRRHFLAVFGHFYILSCRVPLSKGYLRPESPRALTRLRPPPACYRYYPSPRGFASDSSGCSPRSDRSAWPPSAAARSIPPASRPVRERTP